jgi:hypothetical protein
VCALAIGVCLIPAAAKSQETKHESWLTPQNASLTAAAGRSSGALGDFDGDQHADLALAEPQGVFNGAYRYRVDVYLSTDLNTTFDVDSGAAGGLHIIARDVDGDLDLDLVISSEFGREPVGIWINDGHGVFTKGQAETYRGSIWQETEHSLEAPRRPPATTVAIGFPAGSWVTEPAPRAALILSDNLPSRAAAHFPVFRTLNLGSPFRAPPIL